MRTRFALLALALTALAVSTPVRAELVSIATEVMIADQETNNLTLGELFGADPTSPLYFTSLVGADGDSFSYNLMPGSTYLGLNLTMSASGSFDAATSTWTVSMSGMLGSTPFETQGIGDLTKNDDTYTIELDKDKFETDKNGKSVKVGDVHDTLTYNPKAGTSTGALYDTDANGKKIVNSDKAEHDYLDPKTGKWQDGVSPVSVVPAFPTAVFASGTSPLDGGYGSFTATVSAVPEPSSLVLSAIGILGATGYAWRRRKAKGD